MKTVFPDPNTKFPMKGVDYLTYVRPAITNPAIEAGDFTYITEQTKEKHVTHHYGFNGDKLVIGKFCQIAVGGVEFVREIREMLANSAGVE